MKTKIEPRGLARTQAAEYLGLSASTFDRLVSLNQMPQPRLASSNRVVWDRRELDDCFERLPRKGEAPGNPWHNV